MNVYILGAGVSKSAGYPLGKELLDYLEKDAKSSCIMGRKQEWKEFETWLLKQCDVIPCYIRDSGNPEFILTYLDLGTADLKYNRDKWGKLSSAIKKTDDEPANSMRRRLKGIYNKQTREIERVRNILTTSFTEYFQWKHYKDNKSDTKRKLIKEFCDKIIKTKDTVITFNYDSLIERSLLELNKWSLHNGYGFIVKVVNNYTKKPVKLLDSPVKVLKLHGSVGWYHDTNKNDIFLSEAYFLQHFGNLQRLNDIKDPQSPPSYQMPPAVIEPSFIKRINIPELLNLWEQAAGVLSAADKIYIIGYSLPQADSAAQSLITTNFRINNKCNKLVIVNPNGETLSRYKDLLGNSVKQVKCTFEDWVAKGFPETDLRCQ